MRERGWGRTRSGRWVVDALLWPSDIRLIRNQYRDEFGRFPRLLFPRTFNEKIQRTKAFARCPRYTRYADKIAVRDMVKKRVGPHILNELLWYGNDLDEAERNALPHAFVIKANNGSGCNLIVRDAGSTDWERLRATTAEWLKFNRRYDRHSAEWQYRWIEPRLLIEPLLPGPGGAVPLDYKFMCFHGRAEIIQVDVDRFTHHTRALFDRSFNRLPVGLKFPRYEGVLPKPDSFNEMMEIAEALSNGESFMRVDLYDCGRPVFGELTLAPGSGLEHFDPPEWDLRLGQLW